MSAPTTGDAPSVPFLLPSVPSLDDTFGALQIGTFVGLVLYGFTLHQSYRYARQYSNDPLILKALVGSVLILETFNTLLSTHICYYYLTTSFFKPQNLLYGNWSIDLLPLSSGVVIIASQSFFARRVFVVGAKYRPVAALAILLFLGEIGMFSAATAMAFTLPTFSQFRQVTWFISTGSAMAVTADFLLTTVLIISLRQSRTGLKRTDSMIDVLILYSINTGLVTGAFNILSFLFTRVMPDNLVYSAFGIVGTKLYANTLLAALNARQSLASRGMLTFGQTEPPGGPSIAFNLPQRSTTDASNSHWNSVSMEDPRPGFKVIDIKIGGQLEQDTDAGEIERPRAAYRGSLQV